ncbi:serine hydrolase domain-containing protein [Brevundimonas sp.]|uniref:serine hydrolase domain-containing protein n=1 Tax=Brevundimonas sp. TaxID=1871086 RepID=UPI003D09D8C1
MTVRFPNKGVNVTRRGSLALCAGTIATLATPAHAEEGLVDAAAIDAMALEALAANGSPGLQIAISIAGAPVFSRSYGAANLETGAQVGNGSIFRIASLTKTFTAAAIYRLAEAGVLGIDDPVSRWLPSFSALAPLSLHELMTQTAGLHSDEDEGAVSGGPVSQTELADRIARQAEPFDFAPGSAWLYSNANYIVLGAVIEIATGKPYAEAMQTLIFGPLSLGSTAVDRMSEVVTGRVSGYALSQTEPFVFENAPNLPVEQAGGAGSIRSTAGDLCAWGQALLSNRLLSPTSLANMTSPGRLRDGRLGGENRFSPDDAAYGDVQYASGLLISPPSEPLVSLLHYGGIDGFCSMLEIWPAHEVTLAILCNADRNAATPFRSIRRYMTSRLSDL